MDRVAKGSYSFDFDEWKGVSLEAKNFIRKMLEYDATRRYSAEQAINDPWIKKYTSKSQVDVPLMASALKNMTNFRVFFFFAIFCANSFGRPRRNCKKRLGFSWLITLAPRKKNKSC